jgi:hypothetical protein
VGKHTAISASHQTNQTKKRLKVSAANVLRAEERSQGETTKIMQAPLGSSSLQVSNLLCSSCFSLYQVQTLEAIARTRQLGVLQSTLSSQLNITNANFFYVVKVRGSQTFFTG